MGWRCEHPHLMCHVDKDADDQWICSRGSWQRTSSKCKRFIWRLSIRLLISTPRHPTNSCNWNTAWIFEHVYKSPINK